MVSISIIGLDLAKRYVQAHGADKPGNKVACLHAPQTADKL